MTNAKARKIVDIVGERVRREMLARFRPDCCIGTARALTKVFDHFGIAAAPIPVMAAVFNQVFIERMVPWANFKDRAAFETWCEATGAYSVGIAPGGVPESRGFNGHVVVWLSELSAVVDGSIGQMNRPERAIRLPEAMAFELDAETARRFLAGDSVAARANGCKVVYRRIADESFRRSPDWTKDGRTREIVRNLIRAAKGGD